MEPTVDNQQNVSQNEQNKYKIRMTRLIVVSGFILMIIPLFLIIVFFIAESDDPLAALIPSLILLIIGLLGLFVTILGLKWRVEVDNDSLTLYHPFKRPNIRRFTFDEITSAKYGARGLSIYTGDKRAFSIDGFSSGCSRLAIQLNGMSKLKGGLAPQLWTSPEINPCRQCGTMLSDSNEFCWKCGSPQPFAGGAPLPTPQYDQPAPQYQQSTQQEQPIQEQQIPQEQQSLYHQPGYTNGQPYNPTQQPYSQPNYYATQQPYSQPNYYATQQPYMQPYLQPDPQVIENLKNAAGEMDKAINGANGVVIFIAIVNLLFGIGFTFFPDVISGDGLFSDFAGGIYYLIPALLFTGLSFGVVMRSRACILIATIFMVIDAVLLLFFGGFGDAVAFMVMRVFLVISLFTGVRFCFRYHSVVKQHANNAGVDRQMLLKACKPKIQQWQIITCAVLAVVGIGTAAYGLAEGIYVEVLIEVGHEFGVLRSFIVGYDIFITGILLDINKDREFIDLFLDSIRIN